MFDVAVDARRVDGIRRLRGELRRQDWARTVGVIRIRGRKSILAGRAL